MNVANEKLLEKIWINMYDNRLTDEQTCRLAANMTQTTMEAARHPGWRGWQFAATGYSKWRKQTLSRMRYQQAPQRGKRLASRCIWSQAR